MGKIRAFLDSDVLVSAQLSKNGASFAILGDNSIEKVVSQTIQTEVFDVLQRLGKKPPGSNFFRGVSTIKLDLDKPRLVGMYVPYVFDQQDSHVVAVAHIGKAQFLLTHNVKHFDAEMIKRDLQVLVMKPGFFLQYLRSN